MKLTPSELEIMNVLWAAKRPLSRSEIIALSTEKSWKDSSIHILLNGLLKKQAIAEDGFTRTGKTYGRMFSPRISCEEFYAKALFSIGGRENLPQLFSALVNSEQLTPDLVDELEEILRQRKKRQDD